MSLQTHKTSFLNAFTCFESHEVDVKVGTIHINDDGFDAFS